MGAEEVAEPKYYFRNHQAWKILDEITVDGIRSLLLITPYDHSGTTQPMITVKDFVECDCDKCWTSKYTAYTPNYDHEIRI